MSRFLSYLVPVFLLACSTSKKMTAQNESSQLVPAGSPGFDKQGHRGCRGLMPENTIPAMIKALDLGCYYA
jgi:glycerophosphoryl diester phosphodiesterase